MANLILHATLIPTPVTFMCSIVPHFYVNASVAAVPMDCLLCYTCTCTCIWFVSLFLHNSCNRQLVCCQHDVHCYV